MTGAHSIRGRMTGWVLPVTGLILLTVIFWSYRIARTRLEADMEAKAVFLTDGAARRIDAKLGVLQGVVNGMALALEAQRLEMPFEAVRAMQTRCLRDYEGVYGVCVAFDPGMQPEGWPDLAAWEYRSAGGLAYTDLSGPDVAHTRDDWFVLPKYLDRPVWSEPYEWEGVLMVTYSAPFYRHESGTRRFAGVITCDLTLDWLDHILAELPLGAGGYGLLMSRGGTYISHPDHNLVLNETVFSIAEERGDPDLRAVGRRMTSGEPGILPFLSFVTGDLSWLAFTPLQTTDWIMAAIISRDEMKAAILHLSRRQAAIGLVGMILLWIAIRYIARSITRPISRLRDAADTLAGGDLNAALPEPHGQDETAALTRAFGTMQKNLQRYMEDLRETTAAREKMQSELRIAHDIQMGLVPKTFPPFPSRRDIDLHAIIEPAREVGGDFYDFFLLEDKDRMVVAIGDVSGKGVPAALFMAVTRSFLRAAFRSESDPAEALTHVGNQLVEGNDSCMFVTLFCAVYCFSDGTLRYANAGHNPPVIRHADGTLDWITEPRSAIAGAMPGIIYTAGTAVLQEGDALLLYTDGVTEAMNSAQDLYGEQRLAVRLSDPAGFRSCRAMMESLLEDIRAFAGGAEQSDDITMLVLKRNAPGDRGEINLSIAGHLDDMQRAIHELDVYLKSKESSPRLTYAARLALEELVTNTIKYGYDDDQAHVIEVSFRMDPEPEMILSDDGRAFNPLTEAPAPDLSLSLEEKPIGGLGLHMLREMGLTLTYERRGNRNFIQIRFPERMAK